MSRSLWNPDSVRDVAESVGLASLSDDITGALSRDIEFRLSCVLSEALKFMKHSKRTVLSTSDVSSALRVLDIEPLYGYESTRALRFGEASIGPGQPLFYVEDEEVDFEKLINAPLPKVPREISFTAHWLSVEGVQPSIPQNPTTADSRAQDLAPKGPSANPYLPALAGESMASSTTSKPQVKHILSRELREYFERITTACLALPSSPSYEYQSAAFASLSSDSGIQQLVPYFQHFITEKVTHSLSSIHILTQTLHLTAALLSNPSIYLAPIATSLVPPILTCLIGRKIGPPHNADHYAVRDLAGSVLALLLKTHSGPQSTVPAASGIAPRLAKACIKHLLDPGNPLRSLYGSTLGLRLLGPRVVRHLLMSNLAVLGDERLREPLNGDQEQRLDAEKVIGAAVAALGVLEEERQRRGVEDGGLGSEDREKLERKIGSLFTDRIWGLGRIGLVKAIIS